MFAQKEKGNPVYRLQYLQGRITPEQLMRSSSSSFPPNRKAEQLIDVFEREMDVEYGGSNTGFATMALRIACQKNGRSPGRLMTSGPLGGKVYRPVTCI
jgi:hypothetical protein